MADSQDPQWMRSIEWLDERRRRELERAACESLSTAALEAGAVGQLIVVLSQAITTVNGEWGEGHCEDWVELLALVQAPEVTE